MSRPAPGPHAAWSASGWPAGEDVQGPGQLDAAGAALPAGTAGTRPRPPADSGHDLFDATPFRGLVADAEGGVRYWPQLVGQSQAEAWFLALRAGVAWRTLRRPMYERVVDVPRLLAHYPLDALPPGLPLAEMLALVRARVPGAYTDVGLNLYRDGRDSVAMHNDKLHTLVPGQPIALVSLGDARRMNLRAKAGGRVQGIDLAPGSLLAMSHASQLTHEHGIPKTARPVGARMSVVFRARPHAV